MSPPAPDSGRDSALLTATHALPRLFPATLMPNRLIPRRHLASSARGDELALKRLGDERAGLRDTVKLDEGAEAWALRLAEQDFVERGEPAAQRLEAVPLADRIDLGLDLLGEHAARQLGEPRVEIEQSRALLLRRRPVILVRLHEVVEVADGVADELIEQGMGLGRRVSLIAANEAPQHLAILGVRRAREIQKQREADGKLRHRR